MNTLVRVSWALCSVRGHNKFRMIGQAKISNFFNILPSKRLSSEADSPDKDGQAAKKQKVEGSPDKGKQESLENYAPSADSSADLSAEQRKRMEENKLAALAKMTARKTEGVVTNMGPSWLKALQPEFSKPYFVELCKFVASERKRGTVYPPPHQVFTWTQTCAIRDVKVVILGQDPYHGPKQAHGLCFSVQAGVPPPPSLVNMYKELESDIEGFKHPGHGNLTGWAKQGVLLLNACLTVRAHSANSHADHGWEKFTDAVIAWLNNNLSGVVFILWGAYAQKKGSIINKKRHHVLKGPHPSPLSAHRGFFGCKHFSECNRLLKSQGCKPVDWSRLPRE